MNIRGVIHIGAHYGQEYNLYKNHNIKNCLFFEPLPKTLKVLQEKLQNEDVVLVNKALGNDNKKIEMYTLCMLSKKDNN